MTCKCEHWQACHECNPKRVRADGSFITEPPDPAPLFAHRLAIILECMVLDATGTFNEACNLLDEYHEAVRRFNEYHGQPYVSGFGKD